MPQLGDLRLDLVTYAVIEDFKIALAKTPINTDKSYVGVKIEAKSSRLLSARTINNCLTVLRRMLVVARKRGHIESVPDLEWLKCVRPEFDFFDLAEAERLMAAAEAEWRTMILVALRTGLRHGELIGSSRGAGFVRQAQEVQGRPRSARRPARESGDARENQELRSTGVKQSQDQSEDAVRHELPRELVVQRLQGIRDQ